MNTDKLYTEINDAINKLAGIFASFSTGQVNIVPFERSWTAGQLIKHVVMYLSGFVEMINGPVKDTDRAPDKFVEKIKEDFLNFDTKMKSPDFVNPPAGDYNKEELLTALKKMQAELSRSIEVQDLSKTCIGFELPVYGFLTRLEAVNFVLYHTQRHIHQLENIQTGILQRSDVDINS